MDRVLGAGMTWYQQRAPPVPAQVPSISLLQDDLSAQRAWNDTLGGDQRVEVWTRYDKRRNVLPSDDPSAGARAIDGYVQRTLDREFADDDRSTRGHIESYPCDPPQQ